MKHKVLLFVVIILASCICVGCTGNEDIDQTLNSVKDKVVEGIENSNLDEIGNALKEEIKSETSELIDSSKDVVSDIKQEIREEAGEIIDGSTDKLADTLKKEVDDFLGIEDIPEN